MPGYQEGHNLFKLAARSKALSIPLAIFRCSIAVGDFGLFLGQQFQNPFELDLVSHLRKQPKIKLNVCTLYKAVHGTPFGRVAIGVCDAARPYSKCRVNLNFPALMRINKNEARVGRRRHAHRLKLRRVSH